MIEINNVLEIAERNNFKELLQWIETVGIDTCNNDLIYGFTEEECSDREQISRFAVLSGEDRREAERIKKEREENK